MNNKIFIITFLFLGLFQIHGQSLTDTVSQNSKSSMDSGWVHQIIGKWNLYADFYEYNISDSVLEMEMICCNACPSIVFYENFTATLINCSDHQNEIYKWSIKADSLYMEYQGDPSIWPYFPYKRYKLVLTNIDSYLKVSFYFSESFGFILGKN